MELTLSLSRELLVRITHKYAANTTPKPPVQVHVYRIKNQEMEAHGVN